MRQASYDRAQYERLIAAGCPVDPPPGVVDIIDICQFGPFLNNQILELDYGVAYVVNVEIIARRSFRIDRFELGPLPWTPREFAWLEAEGREYPIPGSGLSYPRDMVLNHHAERRTRLQRGDRLEGLLLGYELGGRLPVEHRRTHSLPVLISLYDTLGSIGSATVDLTFSYQRTRQAAARKHMQRPSLFADVEEPFVMAGRGSAARSQSLGR